MPKIIILYSFIFNFISCLNANQDSLKLIHDYAKLLEPSEAIFLEKRLQNYAQKSGIKIYIGNLKTIGRKDIKTYASDLFEGLALSENEKNKAVIILISQKEMQGIIYEGKMLTPYLSDNLKQHLMQSLLIQAFKKDAYLPAYELIFVRLEQLFSEKITPEQLQNQLGQESRPAPGLFFYLQLLMFISLFVVVLVLFGKSVFRKK